VTQLPAVIPPPTSPPPQSFTFNQVPIPMREERQPPPPPTARIEAAPVSAPPAPTRPPETAPGPTRPPETVPAPTQMALSRPPDLPRPVPQPSVVPARPAQPAAHLAAPPTLDFSQAPAIDASAPRTPEMALQEGHAALARRDYAAAERAAREVMGNRTSPRAYDGQFLLAQALVGEKQYAQAAIAFDDAYNRSHKGRHAEDALVGLASSLTSINEKHAACDTLNRLRTEFPKVRADLQEPITKANDKAGCSR
jgi:TolA-binding protein